jgi:hemoglobin-like flavoprotein
MTPEQIELVEKSYAATRQSEDLANRFYEHLFAEHPELRAMFPADLGAQKQKFLAGLDELLGALRDLDGFETRARDLGARHQTNYGVKASHYPVVREALLWAMLGDTPDRDLDTAWRAAYDLVAEAMMSGVPTRG